MVRVKLNAASYVLCLLTWIGAPAASSAEADSSAYIRSVASNEHKKSFGSPEWWIVYVTGALFGVTGVLAWYTARLWRSTKEMSKRQAAETLESLALSRRAVDAALRQAEASVSSQAPYLYPRVSEKASLYPAEPPEAERDHQPSCWLYFENVGRSPAIIKTISAKLFLFHREEMPTTFPEQEALPVLQSSAVIGPGSEGGGKTWTYSRPIDAREIRQLLATTDAAHWSRFWILGVVVYEDVFQRQYSHRFCLKIRRSFQALKGPSEFNVRSVVRGDNADPD